MKTTTELIEMEVYQCDFCSQKSTSEDAMLRHEAEHRAKMTCKHLEFTYYLGRIGATIVKKCSGCGAFAIINMPDDPVFLAWVFNLIGPEVDFSALPTIDEANVREKLLAFSEKFKEMIHA